MIKKGDLVTVSEYSSEYTTNNRNAIVLTDVYASTFTDKNELGKPILTEEKLVVDVLATGNKVYRKIPIELLTRIK